MKNQKIFSIFSLVAIGLLLVFASTCEKDDEDINIIRNIPNTFTDSRDGKVYKMIAIGYQLWMAENLAYLPSVTGPATGSKTIAYYYVYDYNGTNVTEAKSTSNYSTYGVLYNWPAAMNGAESSNAKPSGVQGVCPTGWHLPSLKEFQELESYLGGPALAGGKLKEQWTTHWNSPNTGATNESIFTALPGGERKVDGGGSFTFIGKTGYWWSTYMSNTDNADGLILTSDASMAGGFSFDKAHGYSVRCIKD